MVDDQRVQLEKQSSQAVKLSEQAVKAAQSQNFVEAQALMKQAAEAGRNCERDAKADSFREQS